MWRELRSDDPLARPLGELMDLIPQLCDRLSQWEATSRTPPGVLGRLVAHEAGGRLEPLARRADGNEAGREDGSEGPLVSRVRRLAEIARHLETSSQSAPTAPLSALAAEVLAEHREEAEQHGVELRIAADVPTDRVDAVRTRLVLDHLVSNAIRHREKAGGRVTVSAANVPARPGWWRVVVTDDGPGIPDDRSWVLFEKTLETADPAQVSGLGLLVARWATEQMGGRMVLQTQKNRGTSVTFTVPGRD